MPPATNPTDVIIYHNPDCGTSRNALGLIRNLDRADPMRARQDLSKGEGSGD